MTPLEGLVMGSRPGDIDPGVLLALHNSAGLSFDDLDALLNRDSGMLGLTGMTDMRDIVAAALDGDVAAGLALDVYAHRVRGYIGGYLAQLGHADALVFTAGVGENSVEVRRRILSGLEPLGIRLDTARNELRSGQAREISVDGSPIRILVVPTNEELEIARQSIAAASG
jgi:acetate kinase